VAHSLPGSLSRKRIGLPGSLSRKRIGNPETLCTTTWFGTPAGECLDLVHRIPVAGLVAGDFSIQGPSGAASSSEDRLFLWLVPFRLPLG
jgi:hypothetical protein